MIDLNLFNNNVPGDHKSPNRTGSIATGQSVSVTSSTDIPSNINPINSDHSTKEAVQTKSPLPIALLNESMEPGIVLYSKTNEKSTHVGARSLADFRSDEFPKETVLAYESRGEVTCEDGSIYNFDEATILYYLQDDGDLLTYTDLQRLEKAGFFIKSFSKKTSETIEKSKILDLGKTGQKKIKQLRQRIKKNSKEMADLWFYQYALAFFLEHEIKDSQENVSNLLEKRNAQIDELRRGLTICNTIDDFAKFLGLEIPLAAGSSTSKPFSISVSPLFSEGIQTPSNRNEREIMVNAINRNIEDVRESMLSQIPEFSIPFTLQGVSGGYFNNNQYGLKLDSSLNYDADNKTIQLNGEKPLALCDHIIQDNAIFFASGPAVMCDHGLSDNLGPFNFNSFNDGNGWGMMSQRAAIEANNKCIESLKSTFQNKDPEEVTSLDIFKAHDTAIFATHESLSERSPHNGADRNVACGTTCPQLLTVAGEYAFVTSIGDTKIFKVNADLTHADEPTHGNRGGVNATDCGGRIGGLEPDLRNFSHIYFPVKEGDTLIMCSDGVHDNLDPKMMGLSPQDVDPNLNGTAWNDADPTHLEARNQYMQHRLLNILKGYKEDAGLSGALTPEQVNEAINGWVDSMTLRRKLLFLTTNEKEPAEHNVIPGKVDHAGLLVVQVQPIDAGSHVEAGSSS